MVMKITKKVKICLGIFSVIGCASLICAPIVSCASNQNKKITLKEEFNEWDETFSNAIKNHFDPIVKSDLNYGLKVLNHNWTKFQDLYNHFFNSMTVEVPLQANDSLLLKTVVLSLNDLTFNQTKNPSFDVTFGWKLNFGLKIPTDKDSIKFTTYWIQLDISDAIKQATIAPTLIVPYTSIPYPTVQCAGGFYINYVKSSMLSGTIKVDSPNKLTNQAITDYFNDIINGSNAIDQTNGISLNNPSNLSWITPCIYFPITNLSLIKQFIKDDATPVLEHIDQTAWLKVFNLINVGFCGYDNYLNSNLTYFASVKNPNFTKIKNMGILPSYLTQK